MRPDHLMLMVVAAIACSAWFRLSLSVITNCDSQSNTILHASSTFVFSYIVRYTQCTTLNVTNTAVSLSISLNALFASAARNPAASLTDLGPSRSAHLPRNYNDYHHAQAFVTRIGVFEIKIRINLESAGDLYTLHNERHSCSGPGNTPL